MGCGGSVVGPPANSGAHIDAAADTHSSGEAAPQAIPAPGHSRDAVARPNRKMSATQRQAERRVGVSAETFDTNEQAERKVVPKSGEARTRVRQLLMATSFFSDADKADAQRMTQLIDAFEELRAEAGTNIITQGEQGDSFYLVESGQYEVLILTDARNPFKSWSSSEEYERVCMGTHGPGESFGEVALMYNTARSATVRCVEEGVLWRLDRASFRAIVLASEVSTIARREAFLKSIELFSALTERERSQLVPLLTEEKFADSEYIVSEGDVADCLYLVYDGEVVCHKNEVPAPTTSSAASFLKAREVQMGRAAFTLARRGTEDIIARPVQRGQDLMRLATGDMFGESCLLNTTEGLKSGKEIQERRKANVVAVGNVMMLRLAREDFERVLGTLRDAISSGLKSKILRAVPLLGELPITEREQVIGLFTDVTYKRGQDIVVEGDARKDERRFYIIEEGSVDLYQTPARGTRQEKFASLGRGEFFGERSILTGEPPVATVRAASDVVRCVALAQSDFVKSFGSVEKFLQREMTKRDRTNLQAQKSAVPFHKLELIEVLGTGSFGRVQLVSAPNGRSYALKCMHKAKLVELKQVEHANNERQLMLMCDHPFVLKLHATYQTEDEVFLLIDLVLGGELFSLLGTVRETGGFSEPATRLYAACVVSAIGHMHDREIVYRDLKPENLLLDERGYLRIADLGFAKIVKDRTFTLCGTPDYLAPEMVNHKGHNHSVDWWAVGVLIFELVTGLSPFWADEPVGMYKRILAGSFSWPTEKVLSAELMDLITQLLNVNPSKRLGADRQGAKAVRDHAFFRKMNWEKLLRRELPVPHIPKIKGKQDTSNFEGIDAREAKALDKEAAKWSQAAKELRRTDDSFDKQFANF